MALADRITSQIAAEIAAGHYRYGDALPTRKELMARFRAARGTIDRAIDNLRQLGLVESRQGAGTFLPKTPAVNAPASFAATSIYLCQNTEEVCLESGPYDQRWARLLPGIPETAKYHFLSSEEIHSQIDAIASQTNPRVIWNRPALSAYHSIKLLQERDVPQILVNRPYPRSSYIATDTRGGLHQALSAIKTTSPDASMAVLAPCFDPAFPFLAERELAFNDVVAELGFPRRASPRAAAPNNRELIAATLAALQTKPDFLFIPDSSFVPYALSLVDQAGLKLGADISFIAFGWHESHRSQEGLLCLQQDWDTMFLKALAWALSPRPALLQERVAPKIIHPQVH